MNLSANAREVLFQLVSHVHSHSGTIPPPITYEELARRVGRLNKHGLPHAHGLGTVLGNVGRWVQSRADSWGEPVPCLTCLVVQKAGPNRGLPDEGIKEFWPDYPLLSRDEKRNKAMRGWGHVADFGSRWSALLSPEEIARLASEALPSRFSGVRGRGGESPAHKALKEYVRGNPALLGIFNPLAAICEYPLPTQDEIDVLFKQREQWVAVEVKSRVSEGNESDYERGLYQTIKYKALLQAMRGDSRWGVPADIRSVLLLESRLPASLRALADALHVEVIECVTVPADHGDRRGS